MAQTRTYSIDARCGDGLGVRAFVGGSHLLSIPPGTSYSTRDYNEITYLDQCPGVTFVSEVPYVDPNQGDPVYPAGFYAVRPACSRPTIGSSSVCFMITPA
jgi:hypothetical protein